MASDSPASGYRVLARKYRPARFDQLIGQEAMVRTLANAISSGRLAHAFLLTGVRGVGKTSTARLIAKALNCTGVDGTGGPTISPCDQCDACMAIAESRHLDVLEMDAASRTGVDDVREIIDSVRYAPVMARTKVYIIDEVHMLSKNAFNALLKTLEEPPPHVVFLFATTEIRKVPVTVLSRCQRFDLKRVGTDVLVAHFRHIAELEGVSIDDEALALIARAAEGSVRDGLSILDQAIAHGQGSVTADQLRDMLGLADRGRVLALMAAILAGEAGTALDNMRTQYDLGSDPVAIVGDLLELVHAITKAHVAGAIPAGGEHERQRVGDWAAQLAMPVLQRLWQMLLKGLNDVQTAPMPIDAAEMLVLRLIYAADGPDPTDLVRRLSEVDGTERPAATIAGATAAPLMPVSVASPAAPKDFQALIALLEAHHEGLLGKALRDDVRLVSYAPGRLEIFAMPTAPRDIAERLHRSLKLVTGQVWSVTLATAGGHEPLRQAEETARANRIAAIRAHPLVTEAMALFPDAAIEISLAAEPQMQLAGRQPNKG